MWNLILPVALAALLTGCETAGPRIEYRTVDTSCVGFKPVYINRADNISEKTAQQIEGNNEYGAKKCGWKRTTKKK